MYSYTKRTMDQVQQANITSQADIENTSWAGNVCDRVINILNATGSLSFDHVTYVSEINVFDSPNLELLNFPILSAPSLERKEACANSYPAIRQSVSVDLTGAPAIQEFNYGNLTIFGELVLNSPEALSFPGIRSIYELTMTNPNVTFPDLTSVVWLSISSIQYTDQLLDTTAFPQMTTVDSIKITDSYDLNYYSESLPPLGQLKTITSSILLQSLSYNGPDDISPFAHLHFDDVAVSGNNMSLISNVEVGLDFSGLLSIDGDISFINNTNCSLDLSQLTSVTNLVMTDNVGSMLPFLQKLETAENIHIRGLIDTSSGPNIFPSLKSVPGSVKIEAWNEDFNCSKLVSQQLDSIIHDLSCNGTDNGTTTPSGSTSASRDPSSQGFSDAAKAGIGISVSFIIIGSILAAAWIFFHYRGRRDMVPKDMSSASREEPEIEPPDLSGLHEARTSFVVREAPDNGVHIYEMPIAPAEKPDDHIREMDSPPAEMPGRLSRKSEEGKW